MDKVAELRTKSADLYAKMQAIIDKAEAEGRDLTDEEGAEFDALDTEHKAVEAELEKAEANANRRARAAQLQNRTTGRISTPSQPGTSYEVSGTPNVTGEASDADPKGGFKSHREFLMSVMDLGLGKGSDTRLVRFRAAAGSDEQSTFQDPFGGFLIPDAFMPDLKSLSAEGDPTIGLVSNIPMSSPIVKIPARTDKTHTNSVSGGLRVYRRAESDTVSSSRMEFEQVTLNAHQLYGVAYATEEVLERSPISFVALLEAGFRDEFSAVTLDEKINGSGVGEMEGVLTTPCKIEVAKETGQDADTIVLENILNMAARCWRFGSAIWLGNHNILPQLGLLNQTVGTGGAPVFLTNAAGPMPMSLLGRPVFLSEFPSTLGDAGDLILGVWSEYLVGTLSGLRSAQSMHVRFLEHERTFKFWVENDGRCWWRAALTPKRGSTLSPFVTLAARA